MVRVVGKEGALGEGGGGGDEFVADYVAHVIPLLLGLLKYLSVHVHLLSRVYCDGGPELLPTSAMPASGRRGPLAWTRS